MKRRPTLPAHAGLFSNQEPPGRVAAHQANIDGGSRGNPGPASYGVVIHDARGNVVARLKKYIGRTTNNVAEYYGLIAALDYAEAHAIRALRVESDSELLVKQMRGQYKVKSGDLRPLYEHAKKLSQALEWFRIDHVYREQNAEADALANEAMDEASGRPTAASGQSRGGWVLPPAKALDKPAAALERQADAPGARAEDAQRVRAVYRKGALHPLDRLALHEEEEVQIVVSRSPKRSH
jgi:ribonuclease HI